MPGQIKREIDAIIAQRSKGSATLALCIKTKLILKGLDPDRYTRRQRRDDPFLLAKVRELAGSLESGCLMETRERHAATEAGVTKTTPRNNGSGMKIPAGSGTSPESVLEVIPCASADPSVVVFFCSAQHSLDKLSRSFHAAFPRSGHVRRWHHGGEIVSG